MVGIIILNFNNSEQTLGCLRSLREHVPEGGVRVCVVDNASGKEDYDRLVRGADGSGVTILRSGTNGGYARGNNIGCEFFDGDPAVDKILILNNDTILTMDVVTPMARYLDTHPECGVVFPLVKAPDGSIDRACLRLQKSTKDLFLQATSLDRIGRGCPALLRIPCLSRREFLPVEDFEACPHRVIPDSFVTEVPPGSCMMLPKDLFRKTGWLDPNTFLYFEEHILSARLMKEGRTCVLLPRISIIHLGAQTTKKQPSKAVYRHWRDSYLYFMKEYSRVPRVMQLFLRFRTWLKTLL